MRSAFPQWRGFEVAPEGNLLDQLVDLSGPMGIAHERSVGFFKNFHRHDRPMVVLPRGGCVVRVRTSASGAAHTIDRSTLVIVPEGVAHEDEGVTSIFETLALFPSPALLDEVARDEAIAREDVRRLFGGCRVLSRHRWLEDLTEEYFFERVVARTASARTLAFFERQIVVELVRNGLAARRSRAAQRPTSSTDDVTVRALRYIEANLFSTLELDGIARQAFASPSTLLRKFRAGTGSTPYGYIKTRRLEEARRLLEAGHHPVGDVAALVGYENFAAFSTAFRKQFKRPPSSYRPQNHGRQ